MGAGARWHERGISSLAQLEGSQPSYDAVVVTAGAATPELADVPLRRCRGQNLLLADDGALGVPLICGKYLVPRGKLN